MSAFEHNIDAVFPDWSYGHPHVLHGLIRSMKPDVCVEVGTYLGFGAAWMAQALKLNGNGHLYCIDNFGLNDRPIQGGNPRKHLEENIATLGLTDWVTILEGDSSAVEWPEKVDFAYLDGWHGYLAVLHDWKQCEARGAECICLDDTVQSVGPRMLTMDVRMDGDWDVLDVLRDCGLSVCMRKLPKGPITFSQENPTHPGVDLQVVTKDYQVRHFDELSKRNRVNYAPIMHLLHKGR